MGYSSPEPSTPIDWWYQEFGVHPGVVRYMYMSHCQNEP